MLVLGISGNYGTAYADVVPGMPDHYGHDAAACLIKDGMLVAAVEEERFNRIKKTTKFPVNAIRACLDRAHVSPSRVDAIGYYFREDFVDHGMNTYYVENPTVPNRYSRQLILDWLKDEFDWDLPEERIIYTPHHISHALSSFVRSGLSEALVVVLDGQGEDHSGTVFHAKKGKLDSLTTYSINNSLGGFYEDVIGLIGYRFGDEYKVMGLAPYGDADTYKDQFTNLCSFGEKGDYTLSPAAPETNLVGSTFFSSGFLPRRKGEPLDQRHMDLAAGLQHKLEEIVLHVLKYWADQTGLSAMCFTGGVAHNSSLNGSILRSGLFDEVFIHPASHDAGAAEGAAVAAAYKLGAAPFEQRRLRSASLGTSLGGPDEIERTLKSWKTVVDYEHLTDVVETAAELLTDGAVLGWAQGCSEFGPRALGNRSIIADARPRENRSKINAMVKKRESFRPFAPVVTPEDAATYFDFPKTRANYDFMSFVIDVRKDRREELGAVTHVDGTARVQIIDPATNEQFYRLVRTFGDRTGTPVLLNTSFNNNAEPIVQTVQDALTTFLTTDLDALVIGDFLVRRRTDDPPAFDDFILRFRPATRIAKRISHIPGGGRDVVHEVYLDYATGPCTEVSPAMFALLDAVDGDGTLRSLATTTLGSDLTDEIRAELHKLWQRRFFTLTPR